MTHAPSPWRVDYRGKLPTILDAAYAPVATLAPNAEGSLPLIKAAPNLLQALRLAESTLTRLRPHDGVSGTLDIIRIAIKEATGA